MTESPVPITKTPYSLYEIIRISINFLFIISIVSATILCYYYFHGLYYYSCCFS